MKRNKSEKITRNTTRCQELKKNIKLEIAF